MRVVGNHVVCIRCDRAVREFIVVRIGCNNLKPISGLHFYEKVADRFGKREDFTQLVPEVHTAVSDQNFLVLGEYFIAYSPPELTLKPRVKNDVRRVSCFCCLQKDTRINADDHPIRDPFMDSLAAMSAPSKSAYLPAAQSEANP